MSYVAFNYYFAFHCRQVYLHAIFIIVIIIFAAALLLYAAALLFIYYYCYTYMVITPSFAFHLRLHDKDIPLRHTPLFTLPPLAFITIARVYYHTCRIRHTYYLFTPRPPHIFLPLRRFSLLYYADAYCSYIPLLLGHAEPRIRLLLLVTPPPWLIMRFTISVYYCLLWFVATRHLRLSHWLTFSLFIFTKLPYIIVCQRH